MIEPGQDFKSHLTLTPLVLRQGKGGSETFSDSPQTTVLPQMYVFSLRSVGFLPNQATSKQALPCGLNLHVKQQQKSSTPLSTPVSIETPETRRQKRFQLQLP